MLTTLILKLKAELDRINLREATAWDNAAIWLALFIAAFGLGWML